MKKIDIIEMRDRKKKELTNVVEMMVSKPMLCVIKVGDDYASGVYIKKKKEIMEEIGINTLTISYKEEVTTGELIRNIKACPATGILVQLPLPAHIDEREVLESIPAEKDVDCLTSYNQGRILLGDTSFLPCTVQACVDIMTEEFGNDLKNLDVVVVGRSKLVGMPLSVALTHMNATVTTVHSKSPCQPRMYVQEFGAEAIVTATGVHGILTSEDIKGSRLAIDVGINRSENNKLVGDIKHDENFNGFSKVKYTPVPKGVGVLTVLNVASNLIKLHEMKINKQFISRKR